MEKIIKFFMIFILTGILSCGQNQKTNINNKEVQQFEQDEQNEIISDIPTVYEIEGDNIILLAGPDYKSEKLINKIATEKLGETHYLKVDSSTKVIIVETKGDWSKIKVIIPDWLSDSHIGWIKTKNIVMNQKEDNIKLEKLDSNSYEILKTEHNKTVENFHVLIKFPDFDKNNIFDFIKKFRNENCVKDCNIMIYDTKSILPLIDKYPLQGKDYIKLADHFIAMSSFDSPNLKMWYPYQDILYKEYGGKNWKKEEIK